jgi:hypothetical protein
MSSTSEESSAKKSLDALEALYAAPRRPIERTEPRLAAVSDPPPFARATKLDLARPLTSPGDRLETAMSEFVRRQMQPQPMPEPADLKGGGLRRLLTVASIGVAVAIAVAAVVALAFVNLFPREKDVIQSFAAAAPPSISPPNRSDEPSKLAPSQIRALAPTNARAESATHEQSERLLQQFVQWRQKTALIDKP